MFLLVRRVDAVSEGPAVVVSRHAQHLRERGFGPRHEPEHFPHLRPRRLPSGVPIPKERQEPQESGRARTPVDLDQTAAVPVAATSGRQLVADFPVSEHTRARQDLHTIDLRGLDRRFRHLDRLHDGHGHGFGHLRRVDRRHDRRQIAQLTLDGRIRQDDTDHF